jgi:hypothetical protein
MWKTKELYLHTQDDPMCCECKCNNDLLDISSKENPHKHVSDFEMLCRNDHFKIETEVRIIKNKRNKILTLYLRNLSQLKKSPLISNDLCLKQVCENSTVTRNEPLCSVVNSEHESVRDDPEIYA